jgi:tRNA(Ile)-lysidine synthase
MFYMLFPVIRAFAQKHQLFASGQVLVVGVSGGPDSLTLLHLLTRLRKEYDLNLHAAHLDHGLRADSDADAEFVSRIAEAWDVPCTVERVDAAAVAREKRLSIEEAGRLCRYTFFARLAPAVAIAHTADDQAETVLMHILRGAGLAGLRGMLPKSTMEIGDWRLEILRPLLDVTRDEIEDYVLAHGLEPRRDPTNADTRFFRNRLRQELFPNLETYNPNIRAILRRTAEIAAGDYELVRSLIERVWPETVVAVSSTAVTFDLTLWRVHPLPLRRALLREGIQHLRPGLRDVDFTPVETALDWAQTSQSGHTADLLGGLCLTIVNDMLILGEWEKDRGPALASKMTLVVPGPTLFGDWQFTTEVVASPIEPAAAGDPWMAYIPESFTPLIIRTRRPGDRFQPLGMDGHTVKLSDFMINQKIPVTDRKRWPLLASGDSVLWVCGHRVSERVKAGAGTMLKITARRLV